MKFGQRVIITHRLEKRKFCRKTRWVLKDIEQTEGIFLGFRTVQEGHAEWFYQDYDFGESGWVFNPENYIRTALIAIEGRNPIYVPLTGYYAVGDTPPIAQIQAQENK